MKRAPIFSQRLARVLMQWRWSIFAAGVVLALICAAGMTHIQSQSDYRAFLGEDNADLALSDWLIERRYGQGETLALIYRPADGSLFTPDSMIQFGIIAAAARELPHVRTASTLFDQRKPVALDGRHSDPSAWREVTLAGGLRLTDQNDLDRLRGELLSSELFAGRTIARDGSGALITLVVELSADEKARLAQLSEIETGLVQIRADLDRFRADDTLELTGPAMFARTSQDVLRDDARWLAPIALTLVSIITWLLLRSIAAVGAVLLVVSVTLAVTLGLIGYLGISITILSASGLLLVATLAALDTLHLIATGTLKRQSGLDRQQAAVESIDRNFWPILATSLTDAAGYLALLFSASAAIRGLGMTVAIGAIAAFFVSLMILPALLAWLIPSRPGLAARFAPFSERLGAWSLRRGKGVVLATVLALAIAIPGLAQLQLGDRMQRWFAPDTGFALAMTALEDQYYGLQGFMYAQRLEQDDAELFTPSLANAGQSKEQQPGHIRRNKHAAFDRELQTIAGVERWLTAGSVHNAMAAIPDGSQRFALSAQAAEQLGEDVRPITSFALARQGLMTVPDNGRTDFLIGQADVDSADDRAAINLAERANFIAQSHFPQSDFRIGGIGLAFAKLSDANFKGLALGTAMTLAIVFIAMAFATGTLRSGAVAMIPNILPIVLAFGWWGWAVGEANLALVAVVAVTLGLVVDDTLHVFLKYRRERAEGRDQEQAIAGVMRLNGPVLMTTTLVLVAGFGTLAFSDFLLSAQKSALIAITLAMALLCDLLLSPLLLRTAYPPTLTVKDTA
ncbi:efflux RND transporter permease subunit [Parasphingorhabdus sp. DH2-15]|uniref:efflux RND transporter permease subunit n=1 Tax=Parasphingorhabdus sp. DH2-15 TaxID=3444112 RepID=UPI003F6825D4